MSVLYYNNCWFTNVGEAFIDIGAMKLIQYLFPDQRIVNFSRMSDYYISHLAGSGRQKAVNMWEYIGDEGDYLILPGMFACEEYLNSLKERNFVDELLERGVKLVFLGLGQCVYTQSETDSFRRYLECVRPEFVITRDAITYENFKDVATCINGMDCAFWIKDSYNPSKVKPHQKYDVLTYNRSNESSRALKMIGVNYVRAWHMQYGMKNRDIKDNVLISDTPYDYLSLYACAHEVYTDLVHAAVPALQYGKHVLFERVDKRGGVIDAIENLQIDSRGLLYVDEKDLEKQKNHIVNEISKLIV